MTVRQRRLIAALAIFAGAGCLVAEIRSEPGLAASSSSSGGGGDPVGGSETGSAAGSSSTGPGTSAGPGAASAGAMAGDPGTVLCGAATVACAPGEACCLDSSSDACSAACGDQFTVECDGPEDCPDDQACCWSLAGGACRVSCSPTSERYACQTMEDCAPVPGSVCTPTMNLRAWYNICDPQ